MAVNFCCGCCYGVAVQCSALNEYLNVDCYRSANGSRVVRCAVCPESRV